ncbi:MAG: transposase [Candidatus Competibacteraceae bacterium]
MNNELLELYTDYLISSFGAVTATGLSEMVDRTVSHDRVTRFLSERDYTSRDLWLQVKKTVREVERDDAVLIFDDTIQEKPWTDESELICWHFDHCQNRTVKGMNLLNALYPSGGVSIPVDFRRIRKPIQFCGVTTRQIKRASEVTKNELLQDMFLRCVHNRLKFRYVLMDSWFAAKGNFDLILAQNKHFVAVLKDNRLVALSVADKQQGRFVRVDSLGLADKQAVRGWLKGFDHEVLLVGRVFTNKDGSTGRLSLACSDLTCDGEQVADLHQNRWRVEDYHKSLKSNAALAKSPTRTLRTQQNHVFMTICAVFKLERLKMTHKLNHFALRAKLYVKAIQHAFSELARLKVA